MTYIVISIDYETIPFPKVLSALNACASVNCVMIKVVEAIQNLREDFSLTNALMSTQWSEIVIRNQSESYYTLHGKITLTLEKKVRQSTVFKLDVDKLLEQNKGDTLIIKSSLKEIGQKFIGKKFRQISTDRTIAVQKWIETKKEENFNLYQVAWMVMNSNFEPLLPFEFLQSQLNLNPESSSSSSSPYDQCPETVFVKVVNWFQLNL